MPDYHHPSDPVEAAERAHDQTASNKGQFRESMHEAIRDKALEMALCRSGDPHLQSVLADLFGNDHDFTQAMLAFYVEIIRASDRATIPPEIIETIHQTAIDEYYDQAFQTISSED